jgi:hypothetical protein
MLTEILLSGGRIDAKSVALKHGNGDGSFTIFINYAEEMHKTELLRYLIF